MLSRHWNHFVVWDKDFGQPLHSNSVHFENGLPPVYFRWNIRKCTQLYGCQEWDAWLPNAGHYQPRSRTHCIRKFGFPCAFSCDWSFLPLFSYFFFFFFFITANYAVPFAQMHKTNYVLSHPQLLFQYKIILCSEVGKFQTPFGFGPMVSGKKGLLVFKSFYNVYKRCALLLSRSF